MRRAHVALMSLFLVGPVVPALAPVVAHAAVCGAAGTSAADPGSYPNDPGYAPAERGYTQPFQKNTWDGEDWYLYNCLPQDVGSPPPAGTGTAADPNGMAGMGVDALWNRTPDPQRGDGVLVAYMEGGVNWRIAQSCELKDRAWLDTANLPYPEDAAGVDHHTYDLNGDGFVNVEDYVNDPRVRAAVAALGSGAKSPPGGPFLHHVCSTVGSVANDAGYAPTDITPEDLIVAFGHCQISRHEIGPAGCPAGGRFDNAHDGYPNDINGWNFNRDDNDPQTEQSVYEHFDGESSTLVGEGDNGFADVGLCPECRYIPIKAGDEAIDRPDRVAEAIVFAANHGVNVMDVTDASLGLNQGVQAAIDYAYRKGMVVVWASNDFESADHTDGMFYANVWPGNSITGDHSTRNGATCPNPPSSSNDAFCPWVLSDTNFMSRSSLTSYGPHALFSVPNTDGSTSTGTPTNAGVAALVVAEGLAAAHRGQIVSPLTPNEVRQVVRATATPIAQPCPTAEPCFTGPAGASFNIFYGYGRPNLPLAASTIDANHIPPSANLDSPSWYQEVDPTLQPAVRVSADVAAQRAPGHQYTWRLQYGLGPQPLDGAWTTFAAGSGSGPATVSGAIDLSRIPASFWSAPYSVDASGRTSIEQYDVSVRVQVFANGDTSDAWAMGEDRRAFHLHHDPSLLTGAPIAVGSSGDASPTLADIEGDGRLDTILPTSDGSVHAYRPDGTEAPGFPVHTNPAPGMDPAYGHNYLRDPTWRDSVVPRPRDPIFSTAAVGDLTHTGALDIVVSTASGYTYAWDGSGRLLPGFPVLNGSPADFGMPVPPPDTPYSFQPENYAAAAPVLAHLLAKGDSAAGIAPTQELDIIQAAGDNQLHAWRPDGRPVPGWPVSTLLPPGTVPSGSQQTHDSKVVTTPAVVDINGDGTPDVVLGLDDTILGSAPAGAGVQAFLMAYDGRGNAAAGSVSGNPALLSGYPVKIPGLVQGYGVAQDFVTQGTESPAIYDDPVNGPQAVVNANLFLPVRVDLKNARVSAAFAPTTIAPAPSSSSCPTPNSLPPSNPGECSLVGFTSSASLGRVDGSQPAPLVFQTGSAAVDVFLGITQTPGIGVRVDNGVGAWDPATGASLAQYSNYVQGLPFFVAPAVADVTGDGVPDVIVPSDSGALMAFDGVTGRPAAGFPKWTGGWSVFTPAVGDLLGDGVTDVAAATREGNLFVWKTGGNGCAGNSEAWHWHQDDWNDGQYGNDTRPPSTITDLGVARQGAGDVLTFTAPGNDWRCGTAASYQVFTSRSPITQGNVSAATPVSVTATPDVAGTKETITIAASADQGFLAVRAVDAAGNIGTLPLGTAPSASTPEFGAGAATGLAAGGVVLLTVCGGRLRRRRARGRRQRAHLR